MACEIKRTEGAVLFASISGVMRLADLEALQSAGLEVIRQGLKARVLVRLENFQGWQKGEDWGDVGFQIARGNDIERIAFVGPEQWRDDVFAFVGKGLRTTQIEFFAPAAAREAESWIGA